MKAIETLSGTVVPLWRADVDTDQIMPKQFLKRIEKTGFGECMFHHWRQDPDFVLNDERYAAAEILVAGPNFGCGSSREHAPWGLQQYGFRAVIAPSFGDIFRINCGKIGLLAIELPEIACLELATLAEEQSPIAVYIDLPRQQIRFGEKKMHFGIDPHTKRVLVEGLDPIELALRRRQRIDEFESNRPSWLPRTIAL